MGTATRRVVEQASSSRHLNSFLGIQRATSLASLLASICIQTYSQLATTRTLHQQLTMRPIAIPLLLVLLPRATGDPSEPMAIDDTEDTQRGEKPIQMAISPEA